MNHEPVNSKQVNLSSPVGEEVGSKLPTCPHQEVIELYHKTLPANPKVREWHKTRQGYLQSRWREKAASDGWNSQTDGLQWWEKFFSYIGKSRFLTGGAEGKQGQPRFVADLEWIIKPTNFAKIIEGKYHS
jgi:hypothetical protein